MKKPTLISLSLLTAVSFSAALVSTTMSTNYIFSKADEKTTTITLDSGKTPQITDGSGSLAYNEHASFTYTNASDYGGGHVSLGVGGTIIKDQASNELVSFKVVFSNGDLTLNTGYGDSEDVCYVYELTSNSSQQVHGNYFKLITNSGVDISEIEITFGCEDEETESHNYSTAWAHDATHHWHECLDGHCVRKDAYAEHNIVDIDIVAPTKETTGSYNGKRCSVCDRVLVEPTVLPVLSETDYDISYRTAMVDGQVRDSEKYTLKTDPSVYFDIGYGDTVYTEYIHAGSSYYSLNRWNEMFPKAEATYDNGVLTINLTGDTIVTAESGGNLDGQLDLMRYDSVVISGSGKLVVAYNSAIDGIEAWNLTIENGATVELTGFDETLSTGFKIYGTFKIDGTATVTNYGHAVGFNTDKDGSSDKAFELNIGSTGSLSIDNSLDGINVWNTPTGGCRFYISGALNIDVSEDAIQLQSQVFVYFQDNARVNLTAVGGGIYNHDENGGKTPDNRLFFSGTSKVNITTTEGCGIKLGNIGRIYVENSAKLNIEAGSSGINGYLALVVANGRSHDWGNFSMSNSSLIVKTKGVTSGKHAMTSNVNPIGARGTDWCATVFNTDGEVLIEKLGDQGSTGIHLGGKNGSDLHFRLLCKNFTIKNCTYAIGCWSNYSSTNNTNKVKLTYTHSDPYAKITVVDCGSICNPAPSGTDSGSPKKLRDAFTSSTVQ